jgi:hypothetical protein
MYDTYEPRRLVIGLKSQPTSLDVSVMGKPGVN